MPSQERGLEVVSNREIRSALMRHLHQMHGCYQSQQGDRLTLEQLEKVHEAMHMDDYACPPHSHRHGIVDNIKLTYGENYLRNVIEGIKSNG